MIKKGKLLVSVAFILCIPLSVKAESVNDQINNLQEQINSLQEQVNSIQLIPGPPGPQGPAGPQGPPGSGVEKFEFIGFSSGDTIGGTGIATINNLCEASFTGSRMCTSVEYMNTVSQPSASGFAWIRAVIGGGTAFGPSYSPHVVEAATGHVRPQGNFTCDGYSDAGTYSYSGLTVNGNGQFKIKSCSLVFPVACCAPAP